MIKVIAGKEKGKTGKVLAVYPKREKLLIEKLNFVKRHMRPTQQYKQGGIIEKEAPLDWSNVMIMCGKCNKTTRVKYKMIEEEKSRICYRCGELITQVK